MIKVAPGYLIHHVFSTLFQTWFSMSVQQQFDTVRNEISGHSIQELANKFGTPTYVYDAEMIVERIEQLKAVRCHSVRPEGKFEHRDSGSGPSTWRCGRRRQLR